MKSTIYLPTYGLANPDRPEAPDGPSAEIKAVTYHFPKVQGRKLVAALVLLDPDTGQTHGVNVVNLGDWPDGHDLTMLDMVGNLYRTTREEVSRFFGLK